MSEVVVRRLAVSDVPALRDISNHYVVHTHVTFDLEPRIHPRRNLPRGRFEIRAILGCGGL